MIHQRHKLGLFQDMYLSACCLQRFLPRYILIKKKGRKLVQTRKYYTINTELDYYISIQLLML